MEYSFQNAKVWHDIVKYLKELYPDAQKSGIFNLGATFVAAQSGQRLMLGITTDGQSGVTNRGRIRGPDLSTTDPLKLRKIFHGCMPSQVPMILDEGLTPRFNKEDIERQRKLHPERKPLAGCYVAKFKYLGAGYPARCWSDDQKDQFGRDFHLG